MALDLAISRAITMARVLERALHDQGFWSMELRGVRVQAAREVREDRVVFRAEFPPMEAAQSPISLLTLYCDDDEVLSRTMSFKGGESFMAEWVLAIPLSVAA